MPCLGKPSTSWVTKQLTVLLHFPLNVVLFNTRILVHLCILWVAWCSSAVLELPSWPRSATSLHSLYLHMCCSCSPALDPQPLLGEVLLILHTAQESPLPWSLTKGFLPPTGRVWHCPGASAAPCASCYYSSTQFSGTYWLWSQTAWVQIPAPPLSSCMN